MARTPEGPPPPPAVQKLRLRYAKRGRLRFSSHRDFQRALERALRRAGVPMAYSAGFNPHPRISYANAAPTGAASEAEYVEIALARRCDPELVRAALDEALPPGLDLVEAVEAGPGALADRLEASVWQIRLPGADLGQVRRAVQTLRAAGRVEVQRMTKNGLRSFDARAAVLELAVPDVGVPDVGVPDVGVSDEPGLAPVTASSSEGSCAMIRVVVRHNTPAVRPDDVLAALLAVADFAPPSPPVVTRLAQGPLVEGVGSVADPLAVEKGSVGA